MKTIEIKSLKLTNFKGIRKLHLEELSNETFIYGDNGVGKTTVFDAFTWLLFGKDSTDRTVFETQTLDENNKVIPKIETEVSAQLIVGGEHVELTRIMRQKWVKKKGALESEYTGNQTVFEWNGVPMTSTEYTKKINTIVDEKVFKMITNPAAFNALKWQDQRNVLIEIAGTITDQSVANGNIDFETMLDKLSGKNLEEYKKQLKASISKSKKEIQMLPTRIDEAERSKPEPLNYAVLKESLSEKQKEIESVNDQISDQLKAQQADIDAQKETQKEIYEIESKLTEKQHELYRKAQEEFNKLQSVPREINSKISNIDSQIKHNEQTIGVHETRITSYKHQIKQLDAKLDELRQKWEDENAKKFEMDESECACPTCKRAFPANEIEEKRKDLEEHFITNQKANKARINQQGSNLKQEKASIEALLSEQEKMIAQKKKNNETLWKERAELSEQLKGFTVKTQEEINDEILKENKPFFDENMSKIEALKQELNTEKKFDNSALKSKLAELNGQADAIKAQLLTEKQIEQVNTRIKELSDEEKQLAQAIADSEKELFTIENFEKEKCNRIEASVNSKFNMVNFKLFETQINGGEVPTCKALINGVPFSDANTASKINAGLDIINTLCGHYSANAPIFIDNRESVVELIPTESQIINLIVSEQDKKLRVEDRPLSYSEYVFKKKLETV